MTLKESALLRLESLLMRVHSKLILLLTSNAELVCHVFRGLAHTDQTVTSGLMFEDGFGYFLHVD